jgi:hypothetical protein
MAFNVNLNIATSIKQWYHIGQGLYDSRLKYINLKLILHVVHSKYILVEYVRNVEVDMCKSNVKSGSNYNAFIYGGKSNDVTRE